MVSERYAREHWPGEEPVGQCVDLGSPQAPNCATVVGVAREVRLLTATEDAPPLLYVPLAQHANRERHLGVLVRTRGAARDVMPAVRAAIQTTDARLPRVEGRALTDGSFAAELAPYRLAAWALGVFGGLALSVAAVGLYAVVAYTVAQRTGEMGVRMAIGARPADVIRLVVGATWRLTALGVALGIPAALTATRALRGRFFGVEAWDPVTFAVVTVMLLAVTLLAAWLPARRAARVDPVTALRA